MVQQKIENVIEERIRPALQSHGGDIEFVSFDETSGVVTVSLRGACGMCPFAQETLRSQVEGVLCQEIPEVKSVTRQE
ncbi:MAG TPA: NifU family protein [Synergistaceae bacterium]|nr:NifU family protein [Synergistaceae bacterium]